MAARQPLGAITDIGPSVPVTIAHGGGLLLQLLELRHTKITGQV